MSIQNKPENIHNQEKLSHCSQPARTGSRNQAFFRWCCYLLGCVILSCGIILNTKTGLGVSPLVSVSYCVSGLTGINFPLLTFVLYSIFCLIQFPVKGKSCRVSDLLQIPFSIGFTLLLNLFSNGLPMIGTIPGKILGLVLAVVCTGVGAAMMVNMNLIPNPADSLANAIGVRTGKGMGFAKNLLDATCIILAAILGLLFGKRLIGIGIGTVCSVIFTGRAVAVFNHFFKEKICRMAGLQD